MKVLPQISVTTTEKTSELFGAKFLELTVGNTDVLISFSHHINQSKDTDVYTLKAGNAYVFKSPSGKLFYFVFCSVASGTSTLDLTAYMGEFERQRCRKLVKTVDPSASYDVTFNGNSIDIQEFSNVEVEIIVTSFTAVTTMDTIVQFSNDNVNWSAALYADGSTAIAFTQFVAVSNQLRQFRAYAKYMRCVYTIAGASHTLTFSTTVTAKE